MREKYKYLTLAPFSYTTPSAGFSTKMALLLFLPQVLMLFVTKSYLSLVQILVTTLASVVADVFYAFIRKKSLLPSVMVFFQGFLIGMFVPQGYPLFLLFLITFFSLFFTSYMFGGFAQSWINPVAISVIFLYLLGTQYFPGFTVNVSHLQTPNIGQQLINDGLIPKISKDADITNFLNARVFKFAGVALPEGYVSIFWDTGALIPAFRFNLLTILATIVLLSFGCIKWIIPSSFLLVYGLLVRIFGLYPYGGMLNQGDILLAIFSSGTMIMAFFLLQWAGTTPQTIVGKVFYGIIAGVVAFFVIGCGTSPIGAMFVVLVLNAISTVIMLIEELVYIHSIRIKENAYDR